MAKSKKILFQVLFLVGFLLATAVFVLFGIKYQSQKNQVIASAAECPGEYTSGFISGTSIGNDGGFWGHYKCENVFEFLTGGCQDNNQGYTAVKPTFDPNFCGLQQIDFFNEGTDPDTHWFESCIISDCNEPQPYCGDGNIDSGEQCDPASSQNSCASGQTCNSSCQCTGGNQPYCGDGIVNNGEQCDPASSQNSCGGEVCNSNCTCGSTPQQCPYSSTEARVQCEPWQDCPWRQNLTIDEGETFRVASFHNGTDTLASDTRLTVTDPNGAEVLNCQPSGNPYTCNTSVVNANTPGTYTLQVRTPGETGSACQASAQVTVRPVDQAIDYEIVKDITDPDNFYFVNDFINFRVTIRNTGDSAFDVISFRDTYDPSRIDYVSVQGRKSGGTNINLTASVNETAGTINIADLTTQLGNLGSGENYILTFRFRALADTSRTCNSAFTNPDNLGEEGDDACLSINRPPDL